MHLKGHGVGLGRKGAVNINCSMCRVFQTSVAIDRLEKAHR